jgi:hypothetical protein
MARKVTFGLQPTTPPPGTFRAIHFPQLALLDQGTNEGWMSRTLVSDGGDTRDLPRTIYWQPAQSFGHMDAIAIGALYEFTIDGEAGVMRDGWGWIADTPESRNAAAHIIAKSLHHNSVDLTEVEVRVVETGDFWDDDFHADFFFDKWKTAATTMVGKPAFANASGEMTDEITAALALVDDTSPLVVDCPSEFNLILADDPNEVIASAAGLPPWDYFHIPESTQHHKIQVDPPDENGWSRVYGHLGLWNTCHDGDLSRCTLIPRPRDNYASFNQPSVLSDRGMVECGPVALYGGHFSLKAAMDDPASAWADVRVTVGRHGPWMSGVARPHIAASDIQTYVARASKTSGHWKGERLRAIVSCNTEAFNTPGSGFSTNENGEIDELVASYPACAEPAPQASSDTPLMLKGPAHLVDRVRRSFTATSVPVELLSFSELSPTAQRRIQEWARNGLQQASVERSEIAASVEDTQVVFDPEVERLRHLALLDLERRRV